MQTQVLKLNNINLCRPTAAPAHVVATIAWVEIFAHPYHSLKKTYMMEERMAKAVYLKLISK